MIKKKEKGAGGGGAGMVNWDSVKMYKGKLQ